MKNDRNKRKKWFMDMLFDKFQDEIDRQHSNENDFARKIYIACDGLKKSISIQAGINDFLIYNLSSVQINPQYI